MRRSRLRRDPVPCRCAARGFEVVEFNEINGTAADDMLIGTECADIISGGDGADNIHARGGSDIIHGGLGNDHIVAAATRPNGCSSCALA